MRTVKLGLAVAMIGCGGQSLDVGRDPARAGAGSFDGAAGSKSASGGRGGAGGNSVGGGAGSQGGSDMGVAASSYGGSGVGGSDQPDGSGNVGATGATSGGTAGTESAGVGGGSTSRAGAAAAAGHVGTGEEPTWPEPDGCKSDAAGNALVGTWEGALEDFYLQPVVSARLVINGASEQGICGTVTWGDAPAPTAPTDPAAPYPSREAWESGSLFGGYEGVAYTLQQGAAQSGLIRFSLDMLEGFRPWCPIQEVFAVDGGWECLPGYEWSIEDGETCQVKTPDGGLQSFSAYQCSCLGPCDCNESTCYARQGDLYRYELTLAEDGDALVGPTPDRIDGGANGYRMHFRREK